MIMCTNEVVETVIGYELRHSLTCSVFDFGSLYLNFMARCLSICGSQAEITLRGEKSNSNATFF